MLTRSGSWPGRRRGYAVADTLQAAHTKTALQMALDQIGPQAGQYLTHHSERAVRRCGLQYCSTEYVSVLESHRVQISMTENGDPLENRIGGPALPNGLTAF
jgi:putative transposase